MKRTTDVKRLKILVYGCVEKKIFISMHSEDVKQTPKSIWFGSRMACSGTGKNEEERKVELLSFIICYYVLVPITIANYRNTFQEVLSFKVKGTHKYHESSEVYHRRLN